MSGAATFALIFLADVAAVGVLALWAVLSARAKRRRLWRSR